MSIPIKAAPNRAESATKVEAKFGDQGRRDPAGQAHHRHHHQALGPPDREQEGGPPPGLDLRGGLGQGRPRRLDNPTLLPLAARRSGLGLGQRRLEGRIQAIPPGRRPRARLGPGPDLGSGTGTVSVRPHFGHRPTRPGVAPFAFIRNPQGHDRIKTPMGKLSAAVGRIDRRNPLAKEDEPHPKRPQRPGQRHMSDLIARRWRQVKRQPFPQGTALAPSTRLTRGRPAC